MRRILTVLVGVVLNVAASGQERESIQFKEIDGHSLSLHVSKPADWSADDRRAAIVFFFGGGWRSGNPEQFFPHCAYLAERGMVAISAEYRVKSRHGVTPVACVADAKSAVRWVRAHADELGIDPDRIAAGGGSAGGHLAATTGVIEGYEEDSEDGTVSSRPNALVLFNPALDVVYAAERFGFVGTAKALSPNLHIDAGEPPAVVFHGTADTTVPFEQATVFQETMRAQGNRCELHAYEGRGHGFFNASRGDGEDYWATVAQMDAFLVSVGFLEANPAS